MGTTQAWCEYNGATPTESNPAADCYWKSTDDNNTNVYTTKPVPAGQPSMWKIHSLKFTGGAAAASLSGLSYSLNANYASAASTPFWTVVAAIPASTTFFYANTGPATSLPGSGGVAGSVGGFTPVMLPVTPTATLVGTWATINQAFTTTSTGPFNAASGNGNTTPVALPASQILYTTALYTQLLTNGSALPGPIAGVTTLTATWTES